MDGDDRRGRARSFLLGGLLGASAAIATGRRRRPRRAQDGRPRRPAGLAAFEQAPCFHELAEAAAEPSEHASDPGVDSDSGNVQNR